MKHFFTSQAFKVLGSSHGLGGLKSYKGEGKRISDSPQLQKPFWGFKCKCHPSRGVGCNHNMAGGLETVRDPVQTQHLRPRSSEPTPMAGLGSAPPGSARSGCAIPRT